MSADAWRLDPNGQQADDDSHASSARPGDPGTVVSSNVKALLEQATPRPWRYWAHEDGRSALYPAGPSGPPPILTTPNAEEPNLALIVHAVNSLPAYEAAVDALADLLDLSEQAFLENTGNVAKSVIGDARAALARLRGDK